MWISLLSLGLVFIVFGLVCRWILDSEYVRITKQYKELADEYILTCQKLDIAKHNLDASLDRQKELSEKLKQLQPKNVKRKYVKKRRLKR